MDKQDKIDIINEALGVLYNEVNEYSLRSDFPEERLVYVSESILKLEKLLNLLTFKPIDLTGLSDWKSIGEMKND